MTPPRRARPSARLLIAVGAALLGVAAAAALVLLLTGGSSSQQPAPHPVPTRTGTPAAQPPPTAAAQFGVSVNRLFNDLAYTPAQIDAQLTALRHSGATIARTDAFWEGAEPAPPVNGVHHYDWRFDDTIAAALASHRLRWLPIIDYTAYWAESVSGKDHSPPTLPDDYAAYAAAFAARYGRSGTFWRANPAIAPEPVDVYEIWNEPDGGAFWFPNPNAGQYAGLYLRARDAIAAVQPAARVIVGGLSNPIAFLAAMVAARPDLRGRVDGVGIHPYSATPDGVLATVRSVRALLRSLGMPHVPLYVTEFGWTTRPPGARGFAPAALRPGYLFDTLRALGHIDCGVAMTIVYTWVTPQKKASDGEDWFGIHSPSGAATVDSRAFAAGVRAARSPAPAVKVCG
jgi:polysaccharide biosynthesis protein PslG